MLLEETIRVKYASGLYSNTDIVVEFAPLLGALRILEILSWSNKEDDDIRPDLRQRCLDMPKVHEINSEYHRGLRQAFAEIDGILESDAWKAREFAQDKKRLEFKRTEQLRAYPWALDPIVLQRLYHD